MKRNDLIKGFALMFSVVMLTACSQPSVDNQPSIEGSWVEPIPGMSDQEQGFTLGSDGKATSINMATLQYESWKQDGDLLILSGKSIGNHQTISFTDTLVVEKLSSDSLSVKQKGNTRAYSREKK